MSSIPLDYALNLDLLVLTKLLKRNWSAQGKTHYFQRTRMVVRAIDRHQVQTLRERIVDAVQQCEQSKHKNKRRQEQEEWVLDVNSHQEESKEKIHSQLEALQETVVKGLPEVLSRIEHASSALLTEIARGYFLPFCTISIAALARVRTLVMRVGRDGLVSLRSCWNRQGESSSLFDTTMMLFVEQRDINSHFMNVQRLYRQETRKNLGLPATNSRNNKPDEYVAISETGVATEEAGLPSSNVTSEQHQDEDDLGESVNLLATSKHSSMVKHRSKEKSSSRDVQQDANMSFVRQLQASSVPKRRKGGTESQNAKERKKKKRKKKKKADMFDQIFGDG